MKVKYVALAFFILLLFAPTAQATTASPVFQDIEGSFAENAILQLTGQGIIGGLGPDEFGPAQSVSRSHFAVLLAKVLGVQPYSPVAPTFSDLPLTAAESGYVEALVKLDLVAGTGNRIMGAGDSLKREDAAVLLAWALPKDYIEAPLLNGRYLDENQISPYALKSVAHVAWKDLMKGSDNLFRPQEELTRAEAAVLAHRLLEFRKGQALTALPVVDARKLKIKTGETGKIEPDRSQQPLPFATVYGLDDPAALRISADGSFSAGPEPGRAAITVNAGFTSYLIHTDVASAGAAKKTTEESSVTSAVYPPEKELTNGAAYRVEVHWPDPGFRATEEKSYPGPQEGLYSREETWTGFFRQRGRDIIVDLKKAAPVTRISLEFLQEAGSGIYLPQYLDCSISPDGKAWYRLGRVSHSIDPADPVVQSKNFTLTFPPVTARYVKLSFPVDVFVFARHLSIKGGGQPQEPVILAHEEQGDRTADTYLQIPDIKNILLVYSGGRGDLGRWTARDFLPMLAYVDKDYSIAGKMFDTMLFLPYPDLPCTKDGWAAYAEDLFAPGAQLAALEETMARLNKIPDYQGKVQVILTVPYPDGQQEDFGILEGSDSSPLCFSEKKAGQSQADEDRFQAVRWYYDNLMDRWDRAEFKYLNLAGIYWYKESMDPTTPGDVKLVQNVARLVRNDGLKFFWIPFFGAHGYDLWRSYGFHHAFLQPNYYNSDIPPDERMDKAAELAKRYNLGLEIECDDGILYDSEYYDLFYKQLNKAQQLNIDKEASKAYYAGSKTLVKAWSSDNHKIRSIYDDLYKWLSGTYQAPAGP